MTTSLLIILLLGVAFPTSGIHAETNALEILKKADQARGNEDGVEWEIDINSVEKGRRQQRLIKVKARSYSALAEFIAPANVKGEKLLMIDRNMWFIKPGLSKAVPISPRQKLLGGAANGDIASTNYAGDYKIAETAEDKIGNEPCYVFDLAAIDKKVTYDRIKYWISKVRKVGLKAEFYTVSGKLFKIAAFEYTGDSQLFISRMTITNSTIKEDVTVMEYHKVSIKKIPDSTFNLNLLLK
jgi:hypothetical protein